VTRPLLAVVFDAGSATPIEIGAAADGLCDLAFVCDPDAPAVARSMPVLERLGEIVPPGPARRVARRLAAVGTAGVITFSDGGLGCAAALAGLLGLPRHGASTVAALTDKACQRRRLAAAGVEAIRFATIDAVPDAAAAAERVGTPAVLKPRRGSASRSTTLVRTPAECAAAVEAAVAAGETALILEEHLAGDDRVAGAGWGDYVSVESLVQDGRVVHLGVTGKTALADAFRETGEFFPSTVSEATAAAALALATDALAALDVRHAICHTEIKLTAAGPRLIEVNGRLGGHIDDVYSRATGRSPLWAAMRVALGCHDPVDPGRPGCVAYQLFVTPPPWARTVESVAGLRAARALPGVRRVELRKGPGDPVDWRRGTLSAIGTVHGEAADHAALREILVTLEATLVVSYG
jgi:biotin carboxylase